MRCLSKEPEQRPTAVEAKRSLEALLADHKALETTLRPLAAMVPAAGEGVAADEFRSAWGVVLFADVVGFSRIQQAASPTLTGRFLGELYRAMRSIGRVCRGSPRAVHRRRLPGGVQHRRSANRRRPGPRFHRTTPRGSRRTRRALRAERHVADWRERGRPARGASVRWAVVSSGWWCSATP